MTQRAFICGLAGPALDEDERRFLADSDPWGIILFSRNIVDAEQVRRLTSDARDAVGRDLLVLVDQEGGRVQRIRPPMAERHPPPGSYAELYRKDAVSGVEAARMGARLIAHELRLLGLTCDCLPLLDLRFEGAHQIVGDRSYGAAPDDVAELGRAVCEGLLAGGVLPVVKHIPGHGRAMADSHEELPRVDVSAEELKASDFQPFRALNDMPLAMTAHVLYTAFDEDRPATLSPRIVDEVIRGFIGFDGALMSDDLSMKALSGTMASRTEDSFAAGCDLALHCNGEMAEMEAVAGSSPILAGGALRRCDAAMARIAEPKAFDIEEARAMVRSLLPATLA
ncbi:beta-N-acetylhexosaminidase [Terrihabitans sp. B22-R8]|uniref:beta-N-acetylhexosaminidase n=1 Tax=Terrihabitans sp. B22-R8 TaxID=3425128 RepID=UPI00403CEDB6